MIWSNAFVISIPILLYVWSLQIVFVSVYVLYFFKTGMQLVVLNTKDRCQYAFNDVSVSRSIT